MILCIIVLAAAVRLAWIHDPHQRTNALKSMHAGRINKNGFRLFNEADL